MDKLFTVIMYVLWILTIIFLLIITFTNFQYTDLNTIAIVLFVFALGNSFFTSIRKR